MLRITISRLTACVLATAVFGPVSAATLIVPTDYTTIQAAIDAANASDIVLVEPGTYDENLSLRSSIDVRGREAARTWLAPDDAQLPTVNIVGVSDILFANFTLVDASIGISVTASTGVQIANTIFDDSTSVGVVAGINSAVDVTNNVFYANDAAIQRNSINVEVTSNIFRDNVVTITSPLGLVSNDVNVEANCWSSNADLGVGGVDMAYGGSAVIGDPRFVAPIDRDFHLQQGSPCIDIGIGDDIIDNTTADAGAYGGEFADARPFPVAPPSLSVGGGSATDIDVSWPANRSYLVTNTVVPGGYRVYYKQTTPGSPYDGTDAGGGTEPSPIDVGDVTAYTLSDLSPIAPQVLAPRLLTAQGVNEAISLSWESVAGANGYRVHYGIDSTDENQVDVGNVTEYRVSGLVNGSTYRVAVSAVSQVTYFVVVTAVDSTQNRNESALSIERSIRAGPINESVLSSELTAVPETIVAFPPLPDEGGCFIATAAYGADWLAEVQILRDFRDRYLLVNAVGKWLVAQYYRMSPPLADGLRHDESMKRIVRWSLMPIVGFALFLLASSAMTKIVICTLLLGILTRRARYARLSLDVTERRK